MLIDFHTHAFPQKIAGKTLEHLAAVCHSPYHTDGTVAGTIKMMDEWGVDMAVLLPIATKPAQQGSINNFAKEHDGNRILSFGTIHPEAEDALEELHRIKEMGLHGIKLHPVYQKFFVAEDHMLPIYETITKLGLPLVLHTGSDPLDPDNTYALPKELLRVHQTFPRMKLVLAHMGSMGYAQQVLTELAGKDVWFDTAVASLTCPMADFQALLAAHPANRILFATDCPWSTAPAELNYLKQAGVAGDALEAITHKNAESLLGL